MKASSKIKIACLPVAGIADPGQYLMMRGLNENANLHAFNGLNDKFFGIIRTAVKYRVDYIHFDWIESYYFRKFSWLTYLSVPLFFFQVITCRYLFRIRIGWTLHNLVPHDHRQLQLKKKVQVWFARYTSFIRVLSPNSIQPASEILKTPAAKLHFIATGSFVGYYPDSTDREKARKYLSLRADKKIILFLGSLKRYKGVEMLMDACNEIGNQELLLVIAGKSYDADYLMEIKSRMKENIILIDKFIPGDELQYFYHAADFVVLPFSEIENSGSVLMAMGFKKPVIAPKSNVVNFRLSNQEKLLYEEGKLKETIEYALRLDDAALRTIGELNFQQASAFHWRDFGKLFQ